MTTAIGAYRSMILAAANGNRPMRSSPAAPRRMNSSRAAGAANITGRVLMLIGVDDPIVPIEHRIGFEQEMRNGHVDWMHLYGGVEYSFTHPRASDAGVRGIAYDNGAASHAWSAMTVLPEEFFA